jgi:hypothetical protein
MSDAARPCTLYVMQEPARRNELRRLVQDANIHQLADGAIARELHAWLRFSRRDPRWYRDGLNAACMGWSGLEATLARWLLAPRVVSALARIGLHRALCADLDQQSPPAPVICLLATPGDGVAARIEAGRCLERVWLTGGGARSRHAPAQRGGRRGQDAPAGAGAVPNEQGAGAREPLPARVLSTSSQEPAPAR